MYKDKPLICEDCGMEFVFTASEQAFFAEKGWNAPKFCKCCREARAGKPNTQPRRYQLKG